MILVTGSEGLIGRHVVSVLLASGHAVRRFDLARASTENLRHSGAVELALEGVTGVLHLAAVSRVARAEMEPEFCHQTNVEAFGELLRLSLAQQSRPWVIFVSSREVYGQQAVLPVQEDAVLSPVNVYAASKVEGERLTAQASSAGLLTNICRLSNVYGCPHDYGDRVAVAFAAAATWGGVARVDGSDCLFDFTFIADVAEGLCRLVEATVAGERLPPVQFVSGRGTTLGGLARLAKGISAHPVDIVEAPARTFDVSRFVGDPTRTRALLGWQATTQIEDGMALLVRALQQQECGGRPALRQP